MQKMSDLSAFPVEQQLAYPRLTILYWSLHTAPLNQLVPPLPLPAPTEPFRVI